MPLIRIDENVHMSKGEVPTDVARDKHGRCNEDTQKMSDAVVSNAKTLTHRRPDFKLGDEKKENKKAKITMHVPSEISRISYLYKVYSCGYHR